MRVAWFLNLDADEELRDPACYAPSPRMLQQIRKYVRRLGELVQPDDVILGEDGDVLDAATHTPRLEPTSGTSRDTLLGQAWCPTPRALNALRAAAVRLPPVPAVDVLQHVNSREFIANWGVGPDGALWLTSVAMFDAWLDEGAAKTAPGRGSWVFKTAFGFAGRGLRHFRPDEPSSINQRWLSAVLQRDGGVQIEPWVQRQLDFGLHGWIAPDGVFDLGRVTVQTCDTHGAWLGSRPATSTDLDDAERKELEQVARRAGQALHDAGYFGPFGVDAYRWRDAAGATRFNACSEVNARYSMGWAVGMPGFRPRYGSR